MLLCELKTLSTKTLLYFVIYDQYIQNHKPLNIITNIVPLTYTKFFLRVLNKQEITVRTSWVTLDLSSLLMERKQTV